MKPFLNSRSKTRWIALPILLVLIFMSPMTAEAARKTGETTETKCLDKIRISRHDNPWRDMTESYQQEEANKHIAAAKVEGNNLATFPHLAAYRIKGEMLMGKDKINKKVVVNSRYFTALEKVDATRLPAGTPKTVGRYLDTSFQSLSPKQIVRFLLEAQVITTYWHLEAELCMAGEKDGKGLYVAGFTGVHRYCTNRCETDGLKFSVTIDRNTGEISVAGD